MGKRPVKLMFYLIFIFTFFFYLKTTAPGILLPDSPEFVASSFSFGIPHPSGYSFYLLSGKVFSFLPVGNLAWRMNLMSTLITSLAVICVYILTNRVIEVTLPENKTKIINKSFAFIVALILAFSHPFWTYAINTEAYSMGSFLLVVAIFLLIQYVSIPVGTAVRSQSNTRVRQLYLLSLFTGLLLAFHTVNLVYVVLFVGFVIVKTIYTNGKKKINIENLLLALFFFLLGISVLFYLPIRSVTSPFINIGDSSKWGEFFKTVTGKIYTGELSLFSIPLREKAYNLLYSLKSIGHQFTLPLTGIGLAGIYLLLKKKIGWT